MNKLSEPDVAVFEHIRHPYTEFDPVPAYVLAAARGARGWGLPTLPICCCSSAVGCCSAGRNRGREHAAFSGCIQAQLRSAGSRQKECTPAGSVPIRGYRPATRGRQQHALNCRLHQPNGGRTARGRIVASIDATTVVSTRPAFRLRWCCLA